MLDDIDEIAVVDEATLRALAMLVVEAKSTRDFLRDAQAVLGWTVVTRNLEAAERVQVRRGDFGEALAAGWLNEEKGLVAPVPKLRYQITTSQTQPSTDLVALEVDSGSATVLALHFVECKLRSGVDNQAGVAAYEQLAAHQAGAYADILLFTLRRLHAESHDLYRPLLDHLQKRDDDDGTDAYEIVLIFDTSAWREEVVEELDDVSGDLLPLTVHAMQIDSLGNVVDRAFATVGVGLVLEDDEA